LTSSEVMGIDDTQNPGLDLKHEIAVSSPVLGQKIPSPRVSTGSNKHKLDARDAEEVIPGGDSAAGGATAALANGVTPEKQEYQYVTYEDGSTYTGQIVDGKREGHGIWQSRAGQYEGQWKADSQHGRGRQTWSDGRVYDGQFNLGRFAGHGRMVWNTQRGLLIYEGAYQDDLKHGVGKFVWADGRTYDGEWQRGKRHGKGTYMNSRGERKVGFWSEDKFEGWETPTAAKTGAISAGVRPAK